MSIDKIIQTKRFKVVPSSVWEELKTVQKGLSGELYDDLWMESAETEFVRKQGGVFVNDAFIELWNKDSGILFLDGGYGSSKTTYVITRLLVKAIENKQFKCYYGRQKKTEARELHDNIVREIERNNWNNEFYYSKKPNGVTTITHKNGNSFHLFGCDDDDSLKGIDNPTDILIDEINQIAFSSFGMLITRLRTPGVPLQLSGCFNNCDVYPGHWILKYIYNKDEMESIDEADVVIAEALKKSNIVRHHSTYLDNKFQNPHNYYEKLRIKAGGDEAKIKAYCDGDWGVQLNSQPYYKKFNSAKTVQIASVDNCSDWNRNKPLLISWDENANPYLPLIIAQESGNKMIIIDEIAAKNPNNTVEWCCQEIKRRYPPEEHKGGLEIFGDATSKKQDVKLEKGKNFYTIISYNLSEYETVRERVPSSNPNGKMRGGFINMIFHNCYDGVEIIIRPNCKNLIADLKNCPEDPNEKGKLKQGSMVDGVRGVQRWGHFGDTLDYLMCEYFFSSYNRFQNGVVSFAPKGGGRVVSNTMGDAIAVPEKQRIDGNGKQSEFSFMKYKRQSRNGY